MQCLNPIYVPNPSRFVAPSMRDRLVVVARCGKCAACQQMKHAEYEFRAYKHFEDCVNRGGFVLFDTLTYKRAPRLTDYDEFKSLPSYRDFMCFNSRDITLFHKRLRKRIKTRFGYGSDAYGYFLATEYGLDNRFTHRPHIHVLFYVYKDIPPLEFSRMVAESWQNGRTDGIPFKSPMYVQNNVFTSLSKGGRNVCKYVSKYVQKDNAFQRQINKRIDYVLFQLVNFDFDKLHSDEMKRYRLHLSRLVNQFHRQSLGFGASVLNGLNEEELFDRGFFLMPNGKPNMYSKIPIAPYYLRKMCYQVVTLDDGYKCWSPRPDKIYLLDKRSKSIVSNLSKSLSAECHSFGFFPDVDFGALADYVYNYKGRFRTGDFTEIMPIFNKVYKSKYFVYASSADKNHYGNKFVSDCYLGYKDNYQPVRGRVYPLKRFFDFFAINQDTFSQFNGFDDILFRLDEYNAAVADSRQSASDVRQHTNKLIKALTAP